jgi:hypothetical protein
MNFAVQVLFACYKAATRIGQTIPAHQEDGVSDLQFFYGLPLRGFSQIRLNRVRAPHVGGSLPLASFIPGPIKRESLRLFLATG